MRVVFFKCTVYLLIWSEGTDISLLLLFLCSNEALQQGGGTHSRQVTPQIRQLRTGRKGKSVKAYYIRHTLVCK